MLNRKGKGKSSVDGPLRFGAKTCLSFGGIFLVSGFLFCCQISHLCYHCCPSVSVLVISPVRQCVHPAWGWAQKHGPLLLRPFGHYPDVCVWNRHCFPLCRNNDKSIVPDSSTLSKTVSCLMLLVLLISFCDCSTISSDSYLVFIALFLGLKCRFSIPLFLEMTSNRVHLPLLIFLTTLKLLKNGPHLMFS